MDNLCVTAIIYCNFSYALPCITRKNHFLIESGFSRLIRAIGKVVRSVKSVLEKSISITTIFLRNILTLLLNEWSHFFKCLFHQSSEVA